MGFTSYKNCSMILVKNDEKSFFKTIEKLLDQINNLAMGNLFFRDIDKLGKKIVIQPSLKGNKCEIPSNHKFVLLRQCFLEIDGSNLPEEISWTLKEAETGELKSGMTHKTMLEIAREAAGSSESRWRN